MKQNLKYDAVAPEVLESAAGDIPEDVAVNTQGVGTRDSQVSLDGFSEQLKSYFGEGFDIYDKLSQDLLLRHIALNNEQNQRLADALESDPRLAQMLVDMVEGKRNAHSAVARYYGRSLMDVDEDSPECRRRHSRIRGDDACR